LVDERRELCWERIGERHGVSTCDETHGAEKESAGNSGTLAMVGVHLIETRKMWMPKQIGLEERFEIGEGLTWDEVKDVKIGETAVDATEKIGGEAGLLGCIVNEDRQRSPKGGPGATGRLRFAGS